MTYSYKTKYHDVRGQSSIGTSGTWRHSPTPKLYWHPLTKKILMPSFVHSQFSHCPLVWMFCSRKLNERINSVHKRALRTLYLDYCSTFAELLEKDKSVTIHQRNLQLLAVEMFKIVRKIGPELMREIFKYSNDIATRSDRKFQRPNVETESYGKSSTRDLGPILWDQMLPAEFLQPAQA